MAGALLESTNINTAAWVEHEPCNVEVERFADPGREVIPWRRRLVMLHFRIEIIVLPRGKFRCAVAASVKELLYYLF